MVKNIGLGIKPPKEECDDINCPFHGNLNVKKETFTGTIIKNDLHKTVTIQWERKKFIPKFERITKKISKIKAHNPPCINADMGQVVKVMRTKPLSKTKNFVVVEIIGLEKGFSEKMEALEEGKVKETKAELENKKKKEAESSEDTEEKAAKEKQEKENDQNKEDKKINDQE